MPPVRDGCALRRLGRRKVEEARFPLVTVHYGTVLGWMLCLCPYTDTSLVPYRKLPTTVYCNYENGIFARFSLQYLVSCNSTEPEPKTYTFKYKNKLLLKYLNDRAGILALTLSSRRILAGEGTPVRQRMTCVPGKLCPLRMHACKQTLQVNKNATHRKLLVDWEVAVACTAGIPSYCVVS